jgi:EpsI family protein
MKTSADLRIGLIVCGIVCAYGLVWLLTPRIRQASLLPPLASLVPASFGEWREVPLAAGAVDPRGQLPGATDPEAPYDAVLLRGYANPRGDVVVLALAYGGHQRQEVKIHRPELCYTSQGFEVLRRSAVDVPLRESGTRPAQGARLLVRGADRVETVSYWIRIGDIYSRDAWRTRSHIFAEGLRGRVVDGILVRASQMLPDSASATPQRFALQEAFLAELVDAMPAASRSLLVGSAST